jgi:Sel1 repeat
MRAVRIAALMIVAVGAGVYAHADSVQDVLFESCVASGNYRGLPTSESDTCHCWASVISQQLTPTAAEKLMSGESVPFEEESFVGGVRPVFTALNDACPGLQERLDKLNRPTVVLPCKDAVKTRDSIQIEWGCKVDAEKGDPEAQYQMSMAGAELDLYSGYDGARPPGPRVDSLEWLRRSASQGYARAQFALGEKYAQGDGIAKDEAEAARWYTLAADQGNDAAQLHLGVLYEYGRGVSKDFVQAYKWYAIAARDDAARNPKSQAIKNRDYLASKLTSDQRSEAQRLIDSWSPQ